MKILLLLLIMGLTGCAVFDAPKFKPTQYNTELQLNIVPTEDFTALKKKWGFEDLGGMTEYVDFKGKCNIYIPMLKEVRDSYTMCVAGHELFHCMLGNFHNPDEGESCKGQQ